MPNDRYDDLVTPTSSSGRPRNRSGDADWTSLGCLRFGRVQEIDDDFRDFATVRLQGEVTCIKEVHISERHVAFECLSAGWQEERLIFAPNRQ